MEALAMKYLQVLEEKHDYFTGWTTVKNELLTEKERNTRFRYLSDEFFRPVNVKRGHIYWMFGARFAMEA